MFNTKEFLFNMCSFFYTDVLRKIYDRITNVYIVIMRTQCELYANAVRTLNLNFYQQFRCKEYSYLIYVRGGKRIINLDLIKNTAYTISRTTVYPTFKKETILNSFIYYSHIPRRIFVEIIIHAHNN